MSLQNIICVTHRRLCSSEPFLTRMERICAAHPKAVILREKDLSVSDYESLAGKVFSICQTYGVPFFCSGHPDTARQLGCGTHLSFPAFLAFRGPDALDGIPPLPGNVGVSVHSPEEAALADSLRRSSGQLSHLIAGHIYPTDCKQGLPPRGLDFLHAVCKAASQIPVYGIGGVTPERLPAILGTGAAGACVMSGLMGDGLAGFLRK